jgi:molecular chaperone DnaK
VGTRIIGVDLGMTSVIAAYVPGPGLAARAIPAEDDDPSFPAVVGYTREGRPRVGRAARAMITTAPDRAIHGLKRLIGRSIESVAVRDLATRVDYAIVPGRDGAACVEIGKKTLRIPDILAALFTAVREHAELHFGEEVTRAVFTVPAYFKSEQKEAIEEAAIGAGLEVTRFFSEPTAIALAYRFNAIKRARLAILDMGGTRFDVSILQINGPVFDVIGSGGVAYLGGAIIDEALTDHILARVLETSACDLTEEPKLLGRVHELAESAKRQIVLEGEASLQIPLLPGPHGEKRTADLQCDARLLERLSEGLVARTIDTTRSTLATQRMKPQDIDVVLLAGGGMRLPSLRRAIEQFFQREVIGNFPPEQVTALGAALMAHSYERNSVIETIH